MCVVLSAFSFQPSVGNEKSPVYPMTAGAASALLVTVLGKNLKSFSMTCHAIGLLASGVLVYTADIRASLCHFFAWSIFLAALPTSICISSTATSQRLLA